MQKIPANEIRPGDVLYFLGEPHLIAEIAPYDGPFEFILGIARDESGWGISLEDGTMHDVARAEPVWTFCTCQDISRDVFDCPLHGALLRAKHDDYVGACAAKREGTVA